MGDEFKIEGKYCLVCLLCFFFFFLHMLLIPFNVEKEAHAFVPAGSGGSCTHSGRKYL